MKVQGNENSQNVKSKRRWNNRGLVSLFLTFAFIIMLITGIILYILPQGRIAYWVNWSMWGLNKEEWGRVHIVAGFMMLIASGFHIYLNWKPLFRYFITKVSQVKQVNLKREIALSLIVTIFLVAGSVLQWPPLNYLFELEDHIKNSWVISKDHEPPVGHAEQLSLKVLSKRMNFSLAEAVQELKTKGIKFKSSGDSIGRIALANDISPMLLYGMIKPLIKTPEPVSEDQITPEMIEERYAGTGLGKKKLSRVLSEVGVNQKDAQRRLERQGFEFDADKNIKEIAAEKEITPIDVLKVILIEEYSLE